MDIGYLTKLLIRWSEINSGSDNAAGLERMRSALAAEFSKIPEAIVREVPLAGALCGALQVTMRPEAPLQLLFSGHFDTVYGADHPFQTCTLVSPTKLRGPGVTDMKGGIVVMLAAITRFEKSPNAKNLGWEILLTPDEETGSVGSRPAIVAAAARHNFALVFEPARANGDLVRCRKGTGTFTITSRGRAAHAGRDPAAGRNAILALAEYLPQVDALNQSIPGVMLNIGNIRGGGAINIVPDYAEAGINIRTTRAEDATVVLQEIRRLAEPINAREGYHLDLKGSFNRGPKIAGPNEERLFAEWQACAQANGVTVGWQDVGGGSDGNLLSEAGLSSLDGVGILGDHLHSPEEFADPTSILPRASVAATFLERVAAGAITLPSRSR